MVIWFPVAMGGMAIGSAGAGALCSRVAKRLRDEAARSLGWPSVNGSVTASYVTTIQRSSDDGDYDVPVAVVKYAYAVAGKEYTSDRMGSGGYLEAKRQKLEEFVASHPVGHAVPVYYDPTSPDKAVLTPGQAGGDAGQFMFAAVMLALVAVFIAGVIAYVAASG